MCDRQFRTPGLLKTQHQYARRQNNKDQIQPPTGPTQCSGQPRPKHHRSNYRRRSSWLLRVAFDILCAFGLAPERRLIWASAGLELNAKREGTPTTTHTMVKHCELQTRKRKLSRSKPNVRNNLRCYVATPPAQPHPHRCKNTATRSNGNTCALPKHARAKQRAGQNRYVSVVPGGRVTLDNVQPHPNAMGLGRLTSQAAITRQCAARRPGRYGHATVATGPRGRFHQYNANASWGNTTAGCKFATLTGNQFDTHRTLLIHWARRSISQPARAKPHKLQPGLARAGLCRVWT